MYDRGGSVNFSNFLNIGFLKRFRICLIYKFLNECTTALNSGFLKHFTESNNSHHTIYYYFSDNIFCMYTCIEQFLLCTRVLVDCCITILHFEMLNFENKIVNTNKNFQPKQINFKIAFPSS